VKYCEPCQLDHPDEGAFCKSCGKLLVEKSTGAVQLDPCPVCGALVQDNWKFCKQCGHAVESTLVRPRYAAIAQPAGDSEFRKARRKKIGVGVAATLIILIVATAAAAAGWYALGIPVTVQTDPGASKVVIDGQEVGVTNEYGSLTTSRIRAGDHSLTVIREGYDEWKQSFNVSFTDWARHLNVKLNLTRFKLTVSSSPAGSEVLIDNTSMGSTSEATGTLETSPLAPGEHTVVVRRDGYRDWKQTVTLKQDQKLDVYLSSAPVYESDSSPDLEVRNALEGWAQSTRNRDLDSHMRYYADTLDYYYNLTQVPSSRIRDDRSRAFEKFNYFDVRLSNINVQLDSTGHRATVLLDKTFDFRGDNNAFYNGSVHDQLTLTKLGGGWLITGEKELKVYYVNK